MLQHLQVPHTLRNCARPATILLDLDRQHQEAFVDLSCVGDALVTAVAELEVLLKKEILVQRMYHKGATDAGNEVSGVHRLAELVEKHVCCTAKPVAAVIALSLVLARIGRVHRGAGVLRRAATIATRAPSLVAGRAEEAHVKFFLVFVFLVFPSGLPKIATARSRGAKDLVDDGK